jgi:hypothetical protein
MLFCCIDLHSNNCLVVVSDDADKVVYSKRLPNDLAAICAALSPYQQELFGVVVESTYNWYWLVDGLMAAGHSIHLATRRRSSNMTVSSTVATNPMHVIWRMFFGLVCCQRATSCRKLIARSATLRAGACS